MELQDCPKLFESPVTFGSQRVDDYILDTNFLTTNSCDNLSELLNDPDQIHESGVRHLKASVIVWL